LYEVLSYEIKKKKYKWKIYQSNYTSRENYSLRLTGESLMGEPK